MLFMERSQIMIIQQLLHAPALLSSEAIGSVLGLTSKTVRKNIELISLVLKNAGATIVSRPGLGYRIVVEDVDEFNIFLQCFQDKYQDVSLIPRYNEERVDFILHQLLLNDNYIKSEYLCNKLFISQSTFAGELKRAKEVLKKYHLSISHISGKGLIINGGEFLRRGAIADFYQLHEEDQFTINQDYVFDLDLKIVQDTVKHILMRKHIHVNSDGFLDICNYIIAAQYRFSKGYVVEGFMFIHPFYPDEREAAEEIEKSLLCSDSENEVAALSMVIASRRIIGMQDPFPFSKNQEYFSLSNEVLNHIKKRTDNGLSDQHTFLKLLARELRGVLIRSSLHFELKRRPVIWEKSDNLSYEYAVIAYDYLNQKYGLEMPETELAAFSDVFFPFVIEAQQRFSKQKICMISKYGRNYAYSLYRKMQTFFDDYIEWPDFLEACELDEHNIKKWDIIITDIPPSKLSASGANIYQINNRFSNKDITGLQQYLMQSHGRLNRFLDSFAEDRFYAGLDLKNKDEILDFAAVTIEKKECKKFAASLKRREALACGDRGNNVAVVSSLYPVREETKLGLFILKKPVRWGSEDAQIIFVMENGKEADQLTFYMDYLRYLIQDINLICGLLNAKDLNEARNLMSNCLRRKRVLF